MGVAMSIRRCLLLLLVAQLAAACHGGGGGGNPPAGAMTIGAAGATLAISDGRLTGVALAIPAGAFDRPTRVTIVEAQARSHPGFRPLGPAAVVTPDDVAFGLPVSVTLPYGTDVSAEVGIVILAQRANGDIVELGPTVVDAKAKLVTVQAASFARFWVAGRLYGGVQLAELQREFLPLGDGDRWDFDSGLRITTLLTTDEPNLDGAPLFRLQFDSEQAHDGFYLQRDRFGTGVTELLGEFSTAGGGHQQLHDLSSFLPAQVTIGQAIESAYTLVGYAPYGAVTPTFSGSALVAMVAEVSPDVTTPAGTFGDVLRIRVSTTVHESGGRQRQVDYALTLARKIGPVIVEGFGAPARLVRGFVGGEPIGG